MTSYPIRFSGYRAIRVKAIFLLPHRTRYAFGKVLVYGELFKRFGGNSPSNSSRLYQTSHSLSASCRQAVVVPLGDVRMACHLAPSYSADQVHIEELADSNDILEDCKKFNLNPFSSHLMFAYMNHWEQEL